jgi:hypothetical protein
MALAGDLPLPQPMERAPHGALDDLGPFKFGKSSQHGEREFVLGIADVVLGVDDDLLAVLQELVDDDGLICHLPGNAISAQKIDRIEDIRLYVLAQLF